MDDERSVDSDSEPHEAQDSEPEGDGWIDHPDLLEKPVDKPTMPAAPPQNVPVDAPEGDPTIIPEGDDSSDSGLAIATPRTHRRRRREHGPPQWTRGEEGIERHLHPNHKE